MKDFAYYLEKIGEIGFVEESMHSIAYVSGLPGAHPNEIVIFENGELGSVFSLSEDHAEILLFSSSQAHVGTQVVRTDQTLTVPVGSGLLGRTVDPLGVPRDGTGPLKEVKYMPIDRTPPKIMERTPVEKPLETGVTMVDLVVPLGKGQRELIIGDRKTGKTEFLRQTIVSQAARGSVCIYAIVGQKKVDILKLREYFVEQKIDKSTIIVASSSSDSAGHTFLTPYTAMTISESFKDGGMDVVLVLDDMTTHARVYREISLLARRFPGRSSYPGDIFYLHSRLIERAGNFKKGSITVLPVAESILGDLSGYIQTNLMAMTDGHIFFDIDLYNAGKRPAVNPFLSVTRVGHQTQSILLRDVSRELSSFLVSYERMKQFLHFGAEIGKNARDTLALGERVDSFFNQGATSVMPLNVNVVILAGLWAGIWSETKIDQLKKEFEQLILNYSTNDTFKKELDQLILANNSFSNLVTVFRRQSEILTSRLGR
jgi:F-type H+-transporting ATPase subunit alpha